MEPGREGTVQAGDWRADAPGQSDGAPRKPSWPGLPWHGRGWLRAGRLSTGRLGIAGLLVVATASLIPSKGSTQEPVLDSGPEDSLLRVFLDCERRMCDFDHFRREVSFVNYVRDRAGTDFEYELEIGISFTFGSVFNNVVNPRMGSNRGRRFFN